jgi:hypothetical protein
MPSLTSDNNVNVLISTKADLEGVEKTKAGMKTLGSQADESGAKSITGAAT